MKSVYFVNRKGGTGKSTACAEFVLSLKRTGIKCSFFDYDQQEGTFLSDIDDDNPDICAFDTPGALSKETDAYMQDADVVCICSKPSVLDMPSTEVMIDKFRKLKKKDARLVIVIGMFTRWSNSASFLEWAKDSVSNIEGATVTTLLQSEMFPQAAIQGKSVAEYAPRSTAAQSALEMVNAIRLAAGLPKE